MPNHRFLNTLIALLVSFLSPVTVFGWGKEGHEIVGRIAEDRLSVAAQREVRSLLSDLSLSDDEVANWPDEVRPQRPTTAGWHFVNIPVSDDNQPGKFDADRDCNGGDCVIDAINQQLAILKNKGLDKQKRIEALKFIVHFCGDIHQPLHCAKRRYGSADNDRGANAITVRIEETHKTLKLHAVWDTFLVQKAMGPSSVDEYADKLNDRITSAQSAAWGAGDDVSAWANESIATAAAVAYKGIPTDPPAGHQLPLVTDNYVSAAVHVVEEQLMKAGVRLAKLLNEAFPGQ